MLDNDGGLEPGDGARYSGRAEQGNGDTRVSWAERKGIAVPSGQRQMVVLLMLWLLLWWYRQCSGISGCGTCFDNDGDCTPLYPLVLCIVDVVPPLLVTVGGITAHVVVMQVVVPSVVADVKA